MSRPAIGITTRLSPLDASASIEASVLRRANLLRIVVPYGLQPSAVHAALFDGADRAVVLLAVTPQLAALDGFVDWVQQLVHRVPAREVELGLMPAVTSVWGDGLDVDRLAAVLHDAARVVRDGGRRVVWGLRAPIDEVMLSAIASRRLVHDTDALLVDLTSVPDEDIGRRMLACVRGRWPNDRIRVAGGAAGEPGARMPGELEAFVAALDLDAPWVVWEPSADLVRSFERLGPAATALALRPRVASHAASRSSPSSGERALITGGAGFVGSNLAARLLSQGREVVVLDNFDRDGVERNAEWLRARWGTQIRIVPGDVRDAATVRRALDGVNHVFHLAGQVAVTSSLEDPVKDFEVNARGTLEVLEAIRSRSTPPAILFTSTNKVYGDLRDVPLEELEKRYLPLDTRLRARGVDESCSLDLHSPYGCSKGAGDQYMLDFAKSYDVPAVVFRMSCIYGPRQLGSEDQGWVAHFFRHAIARKPITIYGDGKQVRDILFVDDLIDAMLLAIDDMPRASGRAFNIGGGPENALSLLELLEWIDAIHERRPEVTHAPWRRGDQRYYVSDTSRFHAATGWKPKVGIETGLRQLHGWLLELDGAGMKAHMLEGGSK